MTADDVTAHAADYEADAQLTEAESTNILAQITNTVREFLTAEREVKEAEEALKAAQDRLRNITETQLPLLMDEAKQKTLTTLDGYQVTRGEVIRASISQENMPKAAEWLQANGQGAIIKREISLKFGKGEEDKAAEAVGALREHHFAPVDKMSVHPQTLGSVVRELLEAGKEIPMDVLGVYVQPLVKVKRVG